METVKLYYENAFLQDFTAVVESCGAVTGGFAVVLDRTAFYPEGGGQPADHGTLGDARVLDVHEKDGVVTHLCDRALPVGAEVSGHIDWARRFDHMQQHSGEHIVSGLLCSTFHCDNVGFHLGADTLPQAGGGFTVIFTHDRVQIRGLVRGGIDAVGRAGIRFFLVDAHSRFSP